MPAGRPTKLIPEIQEKICEGVKIGLTYERAAVRAGVCEKTFYIWKARGETDERGLYVDFLQALKNAEVEGEAALLVALQSHALTDRPGKWQAGAWILERRHRDRYSAPKAQEYVPPPSSKDDAPRWAKTPEEAGFSIDKDEDK